MIEKALLEKYLAEGLSLPEIGRIVGRPPGTIGYWVRRHGLVANGSARFSPGKGRGLQRGILSELIHQGLTIGQIAKRLDVGVNTVNYWIAKHELPKPREVRWRNRAERLKSGDTCEIRRCHRHGDVEFFMNNAGTWRCRKCGQEAVMRRRRKIKKILVDEAGGGCCICGYNAYMGALQFHHIDPKRKRFNLAGKGHTVALRIAREEAAKCVLLCANCHAEVEAGETQLPPLPQEPD